MWSLALGAWLDSIAATINEQAIPLLLLLNGRTLDTRPLLTHGDIESADLNELATYLQTLTAAGATIFPSPELERHLLELANLPVVQEEVDDSEPDQEEPDQEEPDEEEPEVDEDVMEEIPTE